MALIHACPIARRRIPSMMTPTSQTRPLVHNLQQSMAQAPQRCHLRNIPTSTRPLHTTAHLSARKKMAPKRDRRITLIRYHLQHPLTPRPLRFSRNRSLRHWTIHRAYQLFRSKARQAREDELQRQYQSMASACEALRIIGEDGLAVREEDGLGMESYRGVHDPIQIGVGADGRIAVGSRQIKAQESGGWRGRAESKGGVIKEKKKLGKSGDSATGETVRYNLAEAALQQKEVGRLYRTAMLKTGVWDGVPIEYARAQTETPARNGWDHAWTR